MTVYSENKQLIRPKLLFIRPPTTARDNTFPDLCSSCRSCADPRSHAHKTTFLVFDYPIKNAMHLHTDYGNRTMVAFYAYSPCNLRVVRTFTRIIIQISPRLPRKCYYLLTTHLTKTYLGTYCTTLCIITQNILIIRYIRLNYL